MSQAVRKYVAEFLGTAVLVFFAVGSAVFGVGSIGTLGVAFAFGLVLLVLAYSIGPVSGCHVNPAVTLGVLISRGMTVVEAVGYWIVQFAGAIAGAALIKLMTEVGDVSDQTGVLGTNNWGDGINATGAFILEVVLTFLFVLVVLLVTGRTTTPGFAGLAIGLALAAVHLVGINLDGTSVNPARSLGPALFEGGEPLRHVWLFILAPLVGGLVAAAVAPVLTPQVLPTPDEAATLEAVPADRTGAEVPADRTGAEVPADRTGAEVPEQPRERPPRHSKPPTAAEP